MSTRPDRPPARTDPPAPAGAAADLAGGDLDEVVVVRLAAFGIGEHLELAVPRRFVGRVRSLEPWCSFGPLYSRRVTDSLRSVADAVRTGHPDVAEGYLAYCEEVCGLTPRD